MPDLFFYTDAITPRLKYIVETLFSAAGVQDVAITTDQSVLTASSKPCINYSHLKTHITILYVRPHRLLFEEDIQEQQIDFFMLNNELPAFFKSDDDLGFDVFAAAFYLLSRYEEYLPHEKDLYGRYAHTNSLAYQQNFLHLPLVNVWIEQLKQCLLQRFPTLRFHPQPFSFTPTYDIDIAFNYKGKGLLRNIKGLFADAFRLDFAAIVKRKFVLFFGAKDPADVYDALHQLHETHQQKPIYFFLVADKQSGYDKNISIHSKQLQRLIKKTAREATVGLHPSWKSGDDVSLLKEEKSFLQSIIHQPVTKTRQHYIRMQLPETYRQLIATGIQDDYSMGYGSINGFRASYCLPFRWFDLSNNQITKLTVHPFCFMDANANFEQHLSPEAAAKELVQYYYAVKSVNGNLITVFHNHFLADTKQWKPWKNFYFQFIQKHFNA